MPLFQVQDHDRPLWIIATDFQDALEKWTAVVKVENDGEDIGPPLGISWVASDEDVVVRADTLDMQDEQRLVFGVE